MKAGILEVVDIITINKADKEGADRLKADLDLTLKMKSERPEEWQTPIVLTEAINDKGTEELAEAILRHREFLVTGGLMPGRRRERVKLELMEAVESMVKDFINQLDGGDYLEKLVDYIQKGKTSPRQAALDISRRLAVELDKLKYKN
jgi:LAO/AO transport system kinase